LEAAFVMRVRRPNRHEGDERGMTLIELMVAVTILGFIMSAIASALYMALKLPTDAQSRNTLSTDASFLVNQYSDDVANAPTEATATNWAVFAVTGCTAPFSLGVVDLGTFPQPDSEPSVAYTALIQELSPVNPGYLKVTVNRVVSNVATPLIKGYCKKNDSSLFKWTKADPRYSVKLRIMTDPAGEYREVSLDALRRTYSA
jgi:prepilin-type N-terminal cleavage/methylation domain-containing protein